MKTPILFITFNRPEHTRKVLEAISHYKPSDLYVFQDGARQGCDSDIVNCRQVREIIDSSIDWPCNIKKMYSAENLGCGPGPAKAITWFFDDFERGIIIEDDALPNQDFFEFATAMLERYSEDESIMAIGSMQLEGRRYGDGSYYFSKMNHILCAWATWRRAWRYFDIKLSDFSKKELSQVLKSYGAKLREREYWCARLDEIHKDGLHNSSWDQQFWMTIWRNGGKGIIPNVNLCSNIGFGKGATHTWNSKSPVAAKRTESIMPIIHPSDCHIRKDADMDFQQTYFDPDNYGKEGIRRLPYRLNRRIKRIFHHEGPWIRRRS